MATIRKRGEYSWEAQIRRKGHPTLTKTFLYKADAESWARMVESEIERGVFISRTEAENTTLDEALVRYESEISANKAGVEKEKYFIRRFRADKLAQRSMATIRSADIAAWRDKRLQEVAASTVRRELVLLSHVFSIARREWGMESLQNPVETTSKPKQPKGRDRRVSAEEIDAICTESQSLELPAIIRIAVETGMRRSEIAGICWEHIDFADRTVFLEHTKNGEERNVPLSTAAIATLQAIQEDVRAQRKKAEAIDTPLEGPVFKARPNTITQAFIRAVERARANHLKTRIAAGIKESELQSDSFLLGITFHDLRHEATSRLFELGRFDVMEIASITGHKSLVMLKRYTHLKASNLAKKLD